MGSAASTAAPLTSLSSHELTPGAVSSSSSSPPPLASLTQEERANLSNLILRLVPHSCATTFQTSVSSVSDSLSPLLVNNDPALATVLNVVGEDARGWGPERRPAFRPRVLTLAAAGRPRSLDTATGDVVNLPPFAATADLEALDCVICCTTLFQAVYTPCSHAFCSECITQWIRKRSDCPLCRAPVTAARLRPLSSARHGGVSTELASLARKHAAVQVECPRCWKVCVMREWEMTCGRARCIERRRSNTRAAAAATITECGSSYDELCTWLLAAPPATARRLYIITHRMLNDAGAIGGLLIPGLKHTQVVIEFGDPSTPAGAGTPLMWDRRRANTTNARQQEEEEDDSGVVESSADKPPEKTFVSMELFANREGVVWSVTRCMPELRSTAERLTVYPLQEGSATSESLVDFLCTCRHRTYNLLTWNCQTFVKNLRDHFKLQFVNPSHEIPIEPPVSAAPELVRFLRAVAKTGRVPILASPERDSASAAAASSASASASASSSAASSPHVPAAAAADTRVSTVHVALYAAEDLHRRGLHGVAQLRRVLKGRGSSREEWLRFHTLPVLIFQLQQRQGLNWRDISWVSVELRSDRGLVWHHYPLKPAAGLEKALAATFAYTEVSLECLAATVEQFQTLSYHAQDWSGWQWAEAVAASVAPSLFDRLFNLL